MKEPASDPCPEGEAAVPPQGADRGWGNRRGLFATTQWNVVRAAASADSPAAAQALEILCRTYWRPVYAYLLRDGTALEAARDLTQQYFQHLIASNIPAQADAVKGKFRSFLLLTLKHFLTDEARRARRSRSIPASFLLPLHCAETQLAVEGGWCTQATPEAVFDRSWAETLVNETRRKLAAECESSGKCEFFEAARDFLPGGQAQCPYAELARQLQVDLNVVKVRIHRLRERFGELLRDEIAQTVSSPAEVDEELRYLIDVLSRSDPGVLAGEG
jgi:DNA-directed RNA polymerase specialized sigma24 family protein